MAKATLSIVFSPMMGCAVVFPDVLVPVPGQPKVPSDLIGTTMHVASTRELEDHIGVLGANPSFTKHMEVFHGAETMSHVTSKLQQEIGLAMSKDDVFQCAQEPSCLQVWTTADAFTGKTVRITEVLGSWSMSKDGVGNVCHVNAKKDVAYCHVPSDVYKSGLSWLAMGVPVDEPLREPLPVAVRCHDMGPHSKDAPCHLLSGNEFMAARLENIDTHFLAMREEALITTGPEIVSLGWNTGPDVGSLVGGSQCLDVAGGEPVNGAPLQMWTCLGNGNQRFQTRFPNDQFRIAFADGPKSACVDVPGGNLSPGQTLWLWDCNYGPKWKLEDETQRLQLTDFPTWCLERPAEGNDGDLPYIMPCSDSELQQWTFAQDLLLSSSESMAARLENVDTHFLATEGEALIPTGPEIVSLGWNTGPDEGSLVGGSQCLDVAGGSAVNGAPLQMWTCLGNGNQRFQTRFQSDQWPIWFPDGPKDACVDVPGGNLSPGQTLWLWDCSYTPKWKLEDETQRLQLTDFPTWCLERPASGNDGDLPYMMPCSDSELQQWTFSQDLLQV